MDKKRSFILVTGAAGFIGAALSKKLLSEGENVIGIDDLNDYYDVNLKKSRLKRIYQTAAKASGKWSFFDFSIENKDKYSGCTVHFVDSGVDTGLIIAQSETKIFPEDTIEILQNRIKKLEHMLYPSVIDAFSEGRLEIIKDSKIVIHDL